MDELGGKVGKIGWRRRKRVEWDACGGGGLAQWDGDGSGRGSGSGSGMGGRRDCVLTTSLSLSDGGGGGRRTGQAQGITVTRRSFSSTPATPSTKCLLVTAGWLDGWMAVCLVSVLDPLSSWAPPLRHDPPVPLSTRRTVHFPSTVTITSERTVFPQTNVRHSTSQHIAATPKPPAR